MSVKKISFFLYENYFWIVFIDAVLGLFIGKHYLVSVFLPLSCFYIAAKTPKNSFCFADLFIVLILLSSIISWFVNDYPYKFVLIFRHIMGPIAYMACYFIGKNYSRDFSYSIFEKAFLPALIASVIGLFCFFSPPSWYLNLLLASSETGNLSLESFRLHSVFSSPYMLAYMNGLLLIYIFFRISKDNEPIKKYAVYIIFLLLALMFCMMRAPIAGVLIGFSVSLFYLGVFKNKLDLLLKIIGGSFFVILILVLGLKYTNSETLNYLVEKFEILTDKDENFVEYRYNLVESEESFFGDGAGRHNFCADDYVPGSSMRDGEYQKLQQEVGVFGLIIYIGLISFLVLKCIFYFKYLPFELCVSVFLLISMIGAAPLSTSDKHCYLFWLVMGYISNFGNCEIKRLIKDKHGK